MVSPKERERRFRRIREIGCLACKSFGFYNAPDVHHLNEGAHAGQRRLGDDATIGLCPWHHRGVTPAGMDECQARYVFGPSLKLLPNKFREVFGSDFELLARQDQLIKRADSLRVGSGT